MSFRTVERHGDDEQQRLRRQVRHADLRARRDDEDHHDRRCRGDNKREADEMFFVDLSGNSANSLFTKNRGIGTILNDD